MGAFATTGDNLLSLGGAVVGVGVDALGGNLDDTVKSVTSLSHEDKNYWNEQHSDIYKQLQNEASLIDKDENLTEYDRAVSKAKFYFDNPAYAVELGAGSLVSSVTQLGLGGVALKGLGVLPKASQLVNSFGLGAGSYIAEENETGEVTKETLANSAFYGSLSALINSNNKSLEALLTGSYKSGGKKGLMEFLSAVGVEGGTELLDETSSRIIHNIENDRQWHQGVGSSVVDGAVLGSVSGAIANTPKAIVGSAHLTNEVSQKLQDKANQVIQDKLDPYDYEVHSNINSDKYQPARVFDELTKQINTADENVDVQDLIAKRDKLSTDLFNHWHTLKDSLDNETDESKKDDLQKAFEKADKHLRELNLSQQAIQQAEENNNDIFIKTTLDGFYKMQADMDRAKNSSIGNQNIPIDTVVVKFN